MRAILCLAPAAVLLAACSSPTTYAEPGVGFGDYASYQAQRESALTGLPPAGSAAALPVTSPYGLPPGAVTPPGGIASTDLAAAGIGAAGGPPVPTATLGAPPPPGMTTSFGATAPAAFGATAPAGFGATATPGMTAVASSGVAGDVNIMRSTGIEASPSNAAPVLVGVNPTATPTAPAGSGTGISDEQDFSAVASRETIESDAARRAAQAAQYQVVAPTALPPAPADTGPNIVEYALAAPNAKGQEYYSRFVFSGEGRMLRNCNGYSTPDEAQRDFLARGGPERDPRGLDPDGDGFACAWDPAPFRAAVGGN